MPEGTYRLEIELHAAEALAKRPEDTQVNNGDLDPGRDFVITVRSGALARDTKTDEDSKTRRNHEEATG